MRALHLFSNYKFTGPADPALGLARTLAARGVALRFAAGRHPRPSDPTGVGAIARARGITTWEALALPKHWRPLRLLADVRRLRAELREGRTDVIHCHLPADHLTAVLAARSLGVPVVRTIYDAVPPSGARARFALGATAGVIVYGAQTAERFRALHPDAKARVIVTSPSIDLERFTPLRDDAVRATWGLSPADLVIGVVARMQTHRLFGELIAGFARAAADEPRLRLVILGRGTHAARVAWEPARTSGAADRIVFPGYIDPAHYPRTLPAFDALIYLVPGSDGTCRAAREAMACGVPVIASQRGLLPAFVRPHETGILLEEESPDAIAAALTTLARDDGLRGALARGATAYAREHFAPDVQARAVLALYEELAGAGARVTS